MALGKNVHPDVRRPPLTPPEHHRPATASHQEVNTRRTQGEGFCFKCNNKFGPGHRCKKLFMIEAYLREDVDGDGIAQEAEEEDTPKISLHAITGKDPTKTMKT
jgi:hypothetical protein